MRLSKGLRVRLKTKDEALASGWVESSGGSFLSHGDVLSDYLVEGMFGEIYTVEGESSYPGFWNVLEHGWQIHPEMIAGILLPGEHRVEITSKQFDDAVTSVISSIYGPGAAVPHPLFIMAVKEELGL